MKNALLVFELICIGTAIALVCLYDGWKYASYFIGLAIYAKLDRIGLLITKR